MEIPIPSYVDLFLTEVLNPFFVFQLYSVVLWFYEVYYAFAIVILTVTIISSISNLLTIKANLIKIKEMAVYHSKIFVKRNGNVKEITQSELVPGDILIIKDDSLIPADCIVIKGNVLMNESSLTGNKKIILKKIHLSLNKKYKKANQFQFLNLPSTNSNLIWI